MNEVMKFIVSRLVKIPISLITIFIFQVSIVAAFSYPINFGLNPHNPISETYTYDENASLGWV